MDFSKRAVEVTPDKAVGNEDIAVNFATGIQKALELNTTLPSATRVSLSATGGGNYDSTIAPYTGSEASLRPESTTQSALRVVEAGTYDTLFGHAERTSDQFRGVRVSTMTVGELIQFSDPSGPYGQWVKPRLGSNTYAGRNGLTSTPMGKYQIVGSTLSYLVNKMGLAPDTVFDRKTQDEMFLVLAREAIGSGRSPEQQRARLRSTWEGFKHLDDVTLNEVIREITGNG